MKKILALFLFLMSHDLYGGLTQNQKGSVLFVDRRSSQKKFKNIPCEPHNEAEANLQRTQFLAKVGMITFGGLSVGLGALAYKFSDSKDRLLPAMLGIEGFLAGSFSYCMSLWFASYRFDKQGQHLVAPSFIWWIKMARDKYPYEKMGQNESWDDSDDEYY